MSKVMRNVKYPEIEVKELPPKQQVGASDFLRLRCLEELGELIQAVSKQRRNSNHTTRAHLLEELADAHIVMGWLMTLGEISEGELDKEIKKKISIIHHKVKAAEKEGGNWWFGL